MEQHSVFAAPVLFFGLTALAGCHRSSQAPADVFVRCRTTDANKVTYVHEWKFDLVKSALHEEMAIHPQGLLMRDRLPAVMKRIPEEKRKFITAPQWLVDVVTNELKERHELAIEKRGDKYYVITPSPGGGKPQPKARIIK